jgi:hypothetical protein
VSYTDPNAEQRRAVARVLQLETEVKALQVENETLRHKILVLEGLLVDCREELDMANAYAKDIGG